MGLIDTSSNDPMAQDLRPAMMGGDTFLDRINQLSNARVAAEAAIKELEYKREVKETLDQAEHILNKAQSDADALKAKVTADAIKIMSDARDNADKIRNDAQSWAAQVKAESQKLMDDAEAHAKQIKSETEQARKDLESTKAEAQKIRSDAEALAKDAEEKSQSAVQAIALANEKAKAADDLVARVKAAITG